MTKLCFTLSLLFVCICGVVYGQYTETLDPRWRLIFSDDFNGTALDTSKWTARTQQPKNGGEADYYTADNVYVQNGNLVIKTIPNTTYHGYTYTSGWVDSKDKFYTTYGRYETRTKYPTGSGYWPANWLVSQVLCWPVGSEFDISEFRGGSPTVTNGYFHYGPTCTSTPDWGTNPQGSYTNSVSLGNDFHIYALEWFPTNFSIWVDNHLVLSTQASSLTQAFDNSPHYYIFNTAVGTSGSYAGAPDANTVFPGYQYIDYVRIYAWKPTCSDPNVCSGHGCCFSSNVTCKCDAGWYGSSCEYYWGSYVSTFPSLDTMMDEPVNGWGNGYSLYLANNMRVSNGLILTLTATGCPQYCGNLAMSGGAWNTFRAYPYGTFSFYVRSTKISGTGVTLALTNGQTLLQQIAFIFSGNSPNTVQLSTWVYNAYFPQTTYQLGFDASARYHNYTIVYMPTYVVFGVDGKTIYNATTGVPTGNMQFGIYYGANPNTFGALASKANSSITVTKTTWLVAPSTASCVAPPQPTPPPPLDPCAGTYTNKFQSSDSSDSVQNGWGNLYTIYLSPNVAISNGLTMTITNNNCPSHCGNLPYSGGGWQSSRSFGYGSFSFMAKSVAVSGVGLTLGAADPTGALDQIIFTLDGETPTIANVTTWSSGYQSPSVFFTLPFNTAQAYHNYSFAYTPTSITYAVDGVVYYIQTNNIPNPPLTFGAYFSIEPDWYGPIVYSGPYTTTITSVNYVIYPNVSCGNYPKSTTGQIFSTTQSATITTTGGGTCYEAWVDNFYQFSNWTDSIANGFNNGYTLYFYPNAVINYGLSLMISNVNCPTYCAGYNYIGAGWTSVQTFQYGVYTFIAKASKVSGTALSIGAFSSDGDEQITFTLGGAAPTTSVTVTTFHLEYQLPPVSYTLAYDISAAFHNYTFVYTSTSVVFYVDGLNIATITDNIPSGPLSFGAYYSAEPTWYGPFTYAGLSYAYVQRVLFSLTSC